MAVVKSKEAFFAKSDRGRGKYSCILREIFDSCKLKENVRIPSIMTIEKFVQVKCKNNLGKSEITLNFTMGKFFDLSL